MFLFDFDRKSFMCLAALRLCHIFFFSGYPVQKQGRVVLIGCAILLGHRPDSSGVERLSNHHVAYQAIVISTGFLVFSYHL